jgi:Zn-dependent protease
LKESKLWGTLGLIGLFILTKLKYVLVILKFAKFSTIISMFVSLGVYAMIYGWKFGIAIVYVIFIHEMGHLIAMKIKKIPASPAIFIPFVGAMISVKGEIKDAKTEAFIAYGGPLAGLISILPAIPLYILTEDPLYALIIYLGAFVNLFNLLPVSPLDGGRIVTTLSTHIWALGLLVLLGLNIFMPSPIMILILIFGSITWFIRLSEGKKIEFNEYEENVVKNLISDIQSCEKSKIQLLTGLYDNQTLEGVQQEKLRLEELESLQRDLLKPKSYSFKE